MAPERDSDAELDFVGLPSLRPSSLIGLILPQIRSGHLLKVKTEDPGVKEEVESWVEHNGHEIATVREEGKVWVLYIRRTH